MKLMPDPTAVHRSVLRPKHARRLSATCSSPPTSRTSAIRAASPARRRTWLKPTGVGDTTVFGPEAEFFVFDDVRFASTPFNCGYKIDFVEFPTNTDTDYEIGNLGHRVWTKKRLLPGAAGRFGARPALGNARRHGAHGRQGREASPRSGRRPSTSSASSSRPLTTHGRPVQIYKYCIHRWRRSTARPPASCRSRSTATTVRACTATSRSGRAASRCSPATNMPTSPTPACHYIAGIIKHAKAINAFTNPTTNSYKRLVPGYEAPVLLAYSARNRSASCRIPLHDQSEGQARRGAFPRSAGQSLSRLCGDADGRPRRHREQARSGRSRRQGSLRSAAEGTGEDSDRVRLAAPGAAKSSTRIAPSSRSAACSTTTSSTAMST